jgi:predicted nucleic acid-binding protein
VIPFFYGTVVLLEKQPVFDYGDEDAVRATGIRRNLRQHAGEFSVRGQAGGVSVE